jgi:hypothetical protein
MCRTGGGRGIDAVGILKVFERQGRQLVYLSMQDEVEGLTKLA